MDTGDTAWVLTSAALVLFMTPVALFYGGLVRSKNVLGTMMHAIAAKGLVSILWVLIGYTLAFGPDVGGVIGGLEHVGFVGVGATPTAIAPTIPHSTFAVFQMMFAVITPALIAGAFAERVRFLSCCGRRPGYPGGVFVPHNVPLVILGAAMLWFGWFGFNAGSALGAGGLASSAFVATHLGAAAAMIGWLVPERIRHGKATTVGGATGAVAGLVAITPASGYVGPLPAIVIGLVAGIVCFLAVELKHRLRYDDSLDVVGVHLVGGLVGALLTGVFASLTVNEAGAEGSLGQLGRQAAAAGIALVFAFAATLVILRLVDRTVGFRATEDEEETGVDLVEHGELAYVLRERDRTPGRAPLGMSEAELGALRQQLVLEAAARVLDAIRTDEPEGVEHDEPALD